MIANSQLKKLLVAGASVTALSVGMTAATADDNISAHATTYATTTPRGVSYSMPSKSAPVAAPAQAPVSIPLGIPNGRANLTALKKSASAAQGAPDAGAVIRESSATAAPTPQAVTKLCGNVGVATGFAPSDSHGAVGVTNIVTVKNVTIGVYNKTTCGVVAAEQPLKTFFAPTGVPSTATLFDPRIIWDKWTNRFFMEAESSDSTNKDQYQYFAVSKDGTGTTWWLYRVTLSQGTSKFCKSATNSFWDYPNIGSSRGVNPATASGQGRWFITANDFPASGGATGALLSIDKAASLTGGSVVIKCFAGLPANLAPPIVLDPSTTSQLLSPGSGGGSAIQRRNLFAATTGAGGDTLTAIANVTIPSWVAPPPAAQPNGVTLDTIDGRFQSASIQSRGFIWNVHSIGLSGFSKVRMYRLSTSSAVTTPTLVFTPTTTTAGEHLFNPSVTTASGAVNAPAFITATRTIPSSATSGRATTLVFAGLNASTSSFDWQVNSLGQSPSQFTGCTECRWGDYSATQIDPSASGVAWGFNQMATGTSMFNWTMHTGSVTLNLPYAPAAAAGY